VVAVNLQFFYTTTSARRGSSRGRCSSARVRLLRRSGDAYVSTAPARIGRRPVHLAAAVRSDRFYYLFTLRRSTTRATQCCSRWMVALYTLTYVI